MIYGMPTLLELDTLEKNANLAKELGLSFVEINMNFKQYQMEQLKNIAWLKEIKEKYGIYFTIHLDENFTISTYNKKVANAWYDTLKEVVEVAEQIEAPVLNMHLDRGIYFTLPDSRVFLYEQEPAEYIEGILRLKEYCDANIDGEKMKLCIENTEGYFPVQNEALSKALESNAVGLTWDIGHSYVADRLDEPFIMLHKDKLIHFHIHDSTHKKNHLALGDGELDIKRMVELADSLDARMVLETKTIKALNDSVLWLKDRKLYNSY